MFVFDATSSMQKYIDQTRDRIESIFKGIVDSGNWKPSDLRLGLIAFRDHPQDDKQGNLIGSEFVTQEFGFYDDPTVFKQALGGLKASGGGDGPEAQSDALDAALNSDWKGEATKIVVLVTDSPPHGIGEYNDKFPDGGPGRESTC